MTRSPVEPVKNVINKTMRSSYISHKDQNTNEVTDRFINSCELFLENIEIIQDKRKDNLFPYKTATIRQDSQEIKTLSSDDLAKNAPQMKSNFFIVPKVIE